MKEVDGFRYLCSILNGLADIEAAVKSNFTKARIAIVKLRPVLVSSTVTMKIKCWLIEICAVSTVVLVGKNQNAREIHRQSGRCSQKSPSKDPQDMTYGEIA